LAACTVRFVNLKDAGVVTPLVEAVTDERARLVVGSEAGRRGHTVGVGEPPAVGFCGAVTVTAALLAACTVRFVKLKEAGVVTALVEAVTANERGHFANSLRQAKPEKGG
jgi:hypothetical protein